MCAEVHKHGASIIRKVIRQRSERREIHTKSMNPNPRVPCDCVTEFVECAGDTGQLPPKLA